MITIENDSVKVHVKSIVFDRESYRNPIYWMAAVGSKVALQSVFATLVNKKAVTLEGIEPARVRNPWEYRRSRGYDNTVTVPDGGRMHAVYKKLQSGLSAMVMYSSLTRTDGEDNSHGTVALLCRESDDEKDALFHFLNSKVRIPLCEQWKNWVWDVVSKSGRNMRQLTGYGMVGFHVTLDACEDAIEKAIGPAIKKGVIRR
jgi:hypothetical protein